MEQLVSHLADFYETCYLSLFQKSVKKIWFSLKPDKNNRYFTWRCFHIYEIFHWILLRMSNVLDKSCRENQNIRFVFSNFFFSENCIVYEIMSKNMMEPDRPQLAIWWHIACWLNKTTCVQVHTCARAPTHTKISNTYCFFTATVVSWTHLNVTLYIHCLSCNQPLLGIAFCFSSIDW